MREYFRFLFGVVLLSCFSFYIQAKELADAEGVCLAAPNYQMIYNCDKSEYVEYDSAAQNFKYKIYNGMIKIGMDGSLYNLSSRSWISFFFNNVPNGIKLTGGQIKLYSTIAPSKNLRISVGGPFVTGYLDAQAMYNYLGSFSQLDYWDPSEIIGWQNLVLY